MCIALISTALATTPAQAKAGECPQWEELFQKYGLPVKTFTKIAYRESRCNPKSVSAVRSNGYPDVGLVQISGNWRTVTYQICKLKPSQNHLKALTKVDCNLRVARYLYKTGGLGHWSATYGKKTKNIGRNNENKNESNSVPRVAGRIRGFVLRSAAI